MDKCPADLEQSKDPTDVEDREDSDFHMEISKTGIRGKKLKKKERSGKSNRFRNKVAYVY